jgi:soluble lytic murein transglycosylase-like protein
LPCGSLSAKRRHASHAPTHTHSKAVSKAAVVEHLIRSRHPEKGPHYAKVVAGLVIENARAAHLPVEVVAATAAVESGFSMKSGPCIGMMQVNPATYRERYKKSGLNPYKLRDNIRIGTRELARHYQETASRSLNDRRRLSIMWGRYNGSGPHSAYVRRALKTYDILRRRAG